MDRDHPAPDRLDAQIDTMPLGEILAGEGWAEIGIVGRMSASTSVQSVAG